MTVSPEPYLPQPDASYPVPPAPPAPAAPGGYPPPEPAAPTQYVPEPPPAPAAAPTYAYANGNGAVATANGAAPADLQVIDLSDTGEIHLVPSPRDALPRHRHRHR